MFRVVTCIDPEKIWYTADTYDECVNYIQQNFDVSNAYWLDVEEVKA